MSFVYIIDLLIIVLIVLLFYRVIRKTDAMKIMVGIFIIFVMSLLAAQIGLEQTAQILKKASEMLILGVVFIFHPELRIALRKIGGITEIKINEENRFVSSIEEAVFSLSEKKIGALIILDHNKTLAYQAENLVEVDAKCSAELLETIFFPNTPLHDGAVLIHDDRVAYAGCKLPLSGKKREGLGHLGTRHLAAVENAETFDITAIVVSEETGNISIVTNEGLYRVKSSAMFRKFFVNEHENQKWFGRFKKKH